MMGRWGEWGDGVVPRLLPGNRHPDALPRLLTLCLFREFLFMQFPIHELAFMTTVISLDPPKSPLKRGDFEQISGSPLLKGG